MDRRREMYMILVDAMTDLKGEIPETTATVIEPIRKRFGKHKIGWKITIWLD